MAIKTLGELNREFALDAQFGGHESEAPKAQWKRKMRGVPKIVLIILPCVVILAAMLIATAFYGSESPKTIMGYSFFTVLTSSMQNEIPKGSLIVAQRTEPRRLMVGDNITYIKGEGVTVTHKIVNTYENFRNSGSRGFQTKGVNNDSPDRELVYEKSVIGKVVLTLPVVGAVLTYFGDNINVILIILAIFAITVILLRIFQKQRQAA